MSLRSEVDTFKAWASTYPEQSRSGEWECDYSSWATLYEAATDFLEESNPADWSEEEVQDLLYALARDNEMETISEQLSRNSDMLLNLSRRAINSTETNAKWQLAVQLGTLLNRREEAEECLLQLVEDEAEYVSRRALIALGAMKSVRAEALAERAWASEHEYQRIAALWVLKDVGSDKLSSYLDLAQNDGRRYVVQNATEIREA